MSTTAQELKNADGLPLTSGTVVELTDARLTLKLPGTHYRLELVPAGKKEGLSKGDTAHGVIRCQSQRIDIAATGGRFVEPCVGRPRRIQGRVIGGSAARNEIHVSAGAYLVVTPMSPQRAADFTVGQLVMFDAHAGATFEPSSPAAEA